MKKALTIIFAMLSFVVFAQKETFDLASYTPPQGAWKKEVKENVVSFTIIDTKNKTWCQVGILKSTTSKGSIEQDFQSEWQEFIVDTYNPTGTPLVNKVQESKGWKIKAGRGNFTFNNSSAIAMLTTMSGYNRCVSIVATTNSQKYLTAVQTFVKSVTLTKPGENAGTSNTPVSNSTPTDEIARKDGFAFTSTNFDDGWTSIVKEDWVQVTKGNIKVLLHYPTDKIKAANTDVDVMCAAAWNALVAPRYSSMENYQVVRSVIDYERPYLVQANLTDNATGKKVFVALFKKGNSGWIEIITSDKSSFIQNFGIDMNTVDYYAESGIWAPIQKLSGYNKFAVAASDLKGKWTDSFTGVQQYVNVYTGGSAGMSMHSSSVSFEFMPGNTYKWELSSASGFVGNMKFQGAKSSGKLSLPNNWQIHFSEIEKKPKTYNAYFSCIKGARILWLQNTEYGDYNGYGKKE